MAFPQTDMYVIPVNVLPEESVLGIVEGLKQICKSVVLNRQGAMQAVLTGEAYQHTAGGSDEGVRRNLKVKGQVCVFLYKFIPLDSLQSVYLRIAPEWNCEFTANKNSFLGELFVLSDWTQEPASDFIMCIRGPVITEVTRQKIQDSLAACIKGQFPDLQLVVSTVPSKDGSILFSLATQLNTFQAMLDIYLTVRKSFKSQRHVLIFGPSNGRRILASIA